MKILYNHIYQYRNDINVIQRNSTNKQNYLVETTSFNIKDIPIKISCAYLNNGYYFIVDVNGSQYIEFGETILDNSENYKYTNKIFDLLKKSEERKRYNFLQRLFKRW